MNSTLGPPPIAIPGSQPLSSYRNPSWQAIGTNSGPISSTCGTAGCCIVISLLLAMLETIPVNHSFLPNRVREASASTCASTSHNSIGLAMYESKPAAIARSRSPIMALAVTATTGRVR